MIGQYPRGIAPGGADAEPPVNYAALSPGAPDNTIATTANGRAWISQGGHWVIYVGGDYTGQVLIDTPSGDDVASILADGWTSIAPADPTDEDDGIGLISNTRIQHPVPAGTDSLVGFWEIRIDAHNSGAAGAGLFIFMDDTARRVWISLTYGGGARPRELHEKLQYGHRDRIRHSGRI